MKSLPFISILCLLLPAFSCSQQKTVQPQTVDPLAKYRDTIVGNFSGSQIDTLISEPLDSLSEPIVGNERFHFQWRVYAKNGSVDEVIINNTIGVKLVKEGDLDGDGAEEWGYKSEWHSSNWMMYHVYTYKDGNPQYLYEPSSIWDSHVYPNEYEGISIKLEDIVSPYSCDFIKVKFSDIRNNGENFLLIDTIMPIIR